MLKNNPILSICIPTNGRVELLKKTLSSIFSQINEVDHNDFEVIVSDNHPLMSAECLSSEFSFSNYKYYKSDRIGFENSLNAIKLGSGHMLKLHNNSICWPHGSLKKTIDFVKLHLKLKPQIFFTNGNKNKLTTKKYFNFNDFMLNLSYWSSWSNGFCIWNDDFEKKKDLIVDSFFPQTSILLSNHQKKYFIICDYPLFVAQKIKSKGGYNVFEVFSVNYLNIIKQTLDADLICKNTFDRIRLNLLFDFLTASFYKSKILKIENFDVHNITFYLKKHFNSSEIYLFYINLILFLPRYFLIIFKRFFLKLLNKISNIYELQLFIK